jgi:histidinol-phosphate aminotransferase
VLEAIIREITANANRYPESLSPELARRLAEHHGLLPDQVYIDNGLDAVITRIGITFLNPQDEVVFGALTFPAYANVTAHLDARPVPAAMTPDYRIDVEAVLGAITKRTKIIYLCNPNNPTGTIITREEYRRLLTALPDTALLVMDEAYSDFADDPDYPHTIPDIAAHPNLVVLRTFSKAMGLAGLRVGYALAQAELVRLLRKSREPFPVNRAAQAGALAALDDTEFYERTLQVNRAGRVYYVQALTAMGLRCIPTQANFILVDLEQAARPVFEAMLCAGVIVRPLEGAGAETCLRITIGTPSENARAVAALAGALGRPLPIIPIPSEEIV